MRIRQVIHKNTIRKLMLMGVLCSMGVYAYLDIYTFFSILKWNSRFQMGVCSPCIGNEYKRGYRLVNDTTLRRRVLLFANRSREPEQILHVLKRVDVRKQVRTLHTQGTGVLGLSECPRVPPDLVGQFSIDLEAETPTLENNHVYDDVTKGGVWNPSTCVAKQRVAIVIPYRDRWRHLQTLLFYLIPVLQRQQINFQIFVVEQFGKDIFNKGVLFNAAFLEMWKFGDFDCIVLHDVDLIPINDKNLYTCESYPRHMSPEIDKFQNKLPYIMLVGGVFSMPPEAYVVVNGYSNLFWGWGGEDDDLALRIHVSDLGVIRPPPGIGQYKMFKHDDRESSKSRYKLMDSAKSRFQTDGLNSVQYKLLFINETKLFTHFMINVGDPPLFE